MPERNVIKPSKYGAVVVLQLNASWLALSRHERNAKAEPLRDIAGAYSEDVSFQWFDADALGTGFSDWVMCQFNDLDKYHALWEELRDNEFFAHGYAEIVQVILGLADGYQRFEAGEL